MAAAGGSIVAGNGDREKLRKRPRRKSDGARSGANTRDFRRAVLQRGVRFAAGFGPPRYGRGPFALLGSRYPYRKLWLSRSDAAPAPPSSPISARAGDLSVRNAIISGASWSCWPSPSLSGGPQRAHTRQRAWSGLAHHYRVPLLCSTTARCCGSGGETSLPLHVEAEQCGAHGERTQEG